MNTLLRCVIILFYEEIVRLMISLDFPVQGFQCTGIICLVAF